jgi:hypothetical protein
MPTTFLLAGSAQTQNCFDDVSLCGFIGPQLTLRPIFGRSRSRSTSKTVHAVSGPDSSDFASVARFRLRVFYDNDAYATAKCNVPVSSW